HPPERSFLRAGRPQPAGDLRVAHARRSGGEGSHRALRHLAAGGLATPRHVEKSGARARSPRGTLHLLPRAAARDETAHRLDRALSGVLDGARRAARTTAGDHGRMTVIETTQASQTESIAFDFDLPHAPEKVWRALTNPELLTEWLLPIVELELERGS